MHPQLRNIRRTVVVVDNFLEDPDAFRKFALQQEFQEDKRYFRGQRSLTRHLWPGLKETIERLLGLRIPAWDSQPTNGVFQFCVGGDQLVYHSDHNSHAAVLYLTPDAPPSAGTTIYRSKANKARSVNEAAERNGGKVTEHEKNLITQTMYNGKLLDRTAWEEIDVIGNVYNRLVIWDARMVHAASDYFGTCKEDGRLFQMFFFDCE